jgi:membrane protein implicated in regulation of membrane protease activity
VVTRCDAPTETTLALEAASVGGPVTLVIETVSGAGTLRLDGSDDQDGLTITGEVTSVIVGDAGNVSIEGILPTAERDVPFTVNGTCAGS